MFPFTTPPPSSSIDRRDIGDRDVGRGPVDDGEGPDRAGRGQVLGFELHLAAARGRRCVGRRTGLRSRCRPGPRDGDHPRGPGNRQRGCAFFASLTGETLAGDLTRVSVDRARHGTLCGDRPATRGGRGRVGPAARGPGTAPRREPGVVDHAESTRGAQRHHPRPARARASSSSTRPAPRSRSGRWCSPPPATGSAPGRTCAPGAAPRRRARKAPPTGSWETPRG